MKADHLIEAIEDYQGSTGFDGFHIEISRRGFVKMLGAGLLITVTEGASLGQRGRGGRAPGPTPVAARLHINEDGTFTCLSGKVEEGQGARTELTQAAAEELRVPVDRVRLLMADTDLVPDDGITAGSRTTPSNVPPMRQAAATARELLRRLAARQWQVSPDGLEVRDGKVTDPGTGRTMTYAELARNEAIDASFRQRVDTGIPLASVDEWKVMGQPVGKPTHRDIVLGRHRYPSDVVRPNMLYGKVLRPVSYGATLESVDLSAAQAMKDVVVVRDGQFVGCAAPTVFQADKALAAITATASWKTVPQPSSRELSAHLKEHARTDRARANARGSTEQAFADADKTLSETYELAYIQHTPMEPRAGLAEWTDGKLTVWAGVDGPHRIKGDLARTFGLRNDQVQVIVPDMGGGFGGKHTGEAAEEAARLAQAAGRPVLVRWTRAEEFTWAYFRPAAVIECQAALDAEGKVTAWDFTNINAGGSAIDTPYAIANTRIASVGSDSPLRQGSYRCLAATGNNFARESFMDELAAAAGADPLDFRLAHLENERIRAVLTEAARHFDWPARRKKVTSGLGIGLACGTEKNSVVAACVEVAIDRASGQIKVLQVCEVFECGPIINPANLTSQVQGCIMMGLGGALREEMVFADGKILNASFSRYLVPRFEDVPKIDVHLLNKTDIPSAGGGETPIIAIAPAIGNAVFAATGVRLRSMPMRARQLREAPA